MTFLDKIKHGLTRGIDWLADQVQSATGENERRINVASFKTLAEDFKEKVSSAILRVNEAIKAFNTSIARLNTVRNTIVKENIDALHSLLSKFGNCKSAGSYSQESKKLPAKFPQQALDSIENYIANVDWSNEEVFKKTFFLSPIGIKLKTKKHNILLHQHIKELQLQTDETLRQLELKEFSTKQEMDICSLYSANVEFMSNFISSRIVPELELVEAFFQAEKIKNEILCDRQPLKGITFSYNIKSIEKTKYHCHYQFVKNAVAFYVISCCVYNTPVLTNLLEKKTTERDIQRLREEHSVLSEQAKVLYDNMHVNRGDYR